MLRRNERIIGEVRKEEKKRRPLQTEASDEGKETIILSEVKANALKGFWMMKRRRPPGLPRKRQLTLKENISTFE
jgi:hypothetical protein